MLAIADFVAVTVGKSGSGSPHALCTAKKPQLDLYFLKVWGVKLKTFGTIPRHDLT